MANPPTATNTTNHVNIPWPCLFSQSPHKPIAPSTAPPPQQKTFAQALNNVCDIPLNQLPKSCVKGDDLAISIPEDEYMVGIDACKHNLHGRIILPKGATPFIVESLKAKLAVLWKAIGKWGLMSLGKGYYEFTFSSLEDMRSVRSIGSWSLAPGILKLFAWTTDFNPNLQQQTYAQVWIRIYGLSQEYWRPKILFAIASSIGTPICTDSFTNKPMLDRIFGHYARVLVDLNWFQELRYRILVERVGFAFIVDVEYENLPDVCSNCNIIGHHVGNCKRKKDLNKPLQAAGVVKKDGIDASKTFVPVTLKNTELVKDKPLEPVLVPVVDVAGSSNNRYEQVDHAQKRREEDKVLEDELKEVIEINSVQQGKTVEIPHQEETQSNEDNEFVDATQQLDGVVQTRQVPLVVQNDIEFLKESWAHLVELEDNCVMVTPTTVMANKSLSKSAASNSNALNVSSTAYGSSTNPVPQIGWLPQADKVIPSVDDSQEFQLVVSKSAKKSIKAKPGFQKLSNTYTTRSKNVPPKPSK
jgi:hypothetical protein